MTQASTIERNSLEELKKEMRLLEDGIINDTDSNIGLWKAEGTL